MHVAFHKYEGLGNDFVLADERATARVEPALPLWARIALCHRHTGVGADGVLTLLAAEEHVDAVARMHLTNPDGSVAEMCGNGLRCVCAYLFEQGVVDEGEPFVVATDAGPRRCTVTQTPLGLLVDVEMGPARFSSRAQFPTLSRAAIALGDRLVLGTAVSMGNPHLVLECPPDVARALRFGPALEHDPRFPQRINVELAALASDGALDVVVWERGAGLTQACGTGACAAAAVFVAHGLVPHGPIRVRLPGGELRVTVPAGAEEPLFMRGPARRVFSGEAVVEPD